MRFALRTALLVLGLGTSTGVGGAAERMDATAAAREKGMTDAVLSALHAGQPQELLVRFSNPADDQAIAALRAKSLLSHDSAEIIELRATRFASVKRAVLSIVSRASETEVVRDYDHLPMMFLRFRSAPAILEFLAKPKVVRVYENRIHHALLAESLPLIGQPSVAASGKTGAGTTVAVLDTGVDYTRAAFGFCTSPGVPAGCRVAYSQDFAPNDGQLDDPGVAYHGTNVAGIVVGVAPGARIAALDVFTGDGARDSDILAAGNWCIANKFAYNIVAINLSLGSGFYDQPCADEVAVVAVEQARAAGILVIAGSGNDGHLNGIAFPACTPGILSVGAVYDANVGRLPTNSCTDETTRTDQVTCFSNSASYLTMLAPGAVITAAGLSLVGTSQATPHVSGAVAVLRAAFPSDSLARTVSRLVANGVQVIDHGNGIPKPRLNLFGATQPLPPCGAQTLPNPGSVVGNLLSSDCQAEDANQALVYYADLYRFTGNAGQQVVLEMSSAEFHTWFGLVSPANPNAFAATSSSLGARGARLSFTLPVSGTWTVQASSYFSGESGAYTLTIGSGSVPSICTPNAATVCLNNGRFRVQATYSTADRRTGSATARARTSDTGLFWFFSANNIEAVVKVVNGCSLNQRYWVFAAGLTNVAVTLTVTDTRNGQVRIYTNRVGNAFAPVQDTSAFATCP